MQTKPEHLHRVTELKDVHKGDFAFVLGNGHSITFYDTTKMKETGGYLVGCNEAFKIHPIDYLLWVDGNVAEECHKFLGLKITGFRRDQDLHLNRSNTFYYTGGELPFDNAGAAAFSAAVYMGFNPIFLVGCDCCFLEDERGILKSNVFKDKQSVLMVRGKRKPLIRKGLTTNNELLRFAKIFEELYRSFQDTHDIFQLGKHGILDIPSTNFPCFWSDKHPEKAT